MPPSEEKCRLMIPVVAEGLTWMTVLGNLQLALRHPANNGASRSIAETFVDELGIKLVEEGLFTAEEWQSSRDHEIRAREMGRV